MTFFVEVLTGHLRLVLDVVELGIVLVTDLPKFVYLVACICDLPCCLTCLVSVLCSLVIVVVFHFALMQYCLALC